MPIYIVHLGKRLPARITTECDTYIPRGVNKYCIPSRLMTFVNNFMKHLSRRHALIKPCMFFVRPQNNYNMHKNNDDLRVVFHSSMDMRSSNQVLLAACQAFNLHTTFWMPPRFWFPSKQTVIYCSFVRVGKKWGVRKWEISQLQLRICREN